MRKRQKLDSNLPSGLTLNGASSSHTRRLAARGNVSEPDLQVIESPPAANNRNNPVPNDAEIIDIGTSSDDLGDRVSRVIKSSSPDPILLAPVAREAIHAFEIHPTGYSLSASNKGKGRAEELPEFVVEDSEASDQIEEFTSPVPTSRPSNTKKSPGIPKDIVRDRMRFYESTPAHAPAVVRYPIQQAPSIDLISGTRVSRMKKKDEVGAGNHTDIRISRSSFREYLAIKAAHACMIMLEPLRPISPTLHVRKKRFKTCHWRLRVSVTTFFNIPNLHLSSYHTKSLSKELR